MATATTRQRARTSTSTTPYPRKRLSEAAAIMKHASDASRFGILVSLLEGDRHVDALAEMIERAEYATSHHIRILRVGGFIAPQEQGRRHVYTLTDQGRKLAAVARQLLAGL